MFCLRLCNFFIILQFYLGLAEVSNTNVSVPTLNPPRYFPNGDVEYFPRIVGGSPAKLGEFKGMISIQYQSNGGHFCGGTLVVNRFIVTAAHCLYSNKKLRNVNSIQLMADDLSIFAASKNRQIAKARKFYVHQSYNQNTLQNDVAVISTEKPFKLTDTFGPIPMTLYTPPVNNLCQVAGWGAPYEGGSATPYLLKISIPIVDTNTCNYYLYTWGNGTTISPGMICAGYLTGGKDSCQGDSGGGLIYNNTLAGIVSWGFGCAQPNLPGVYTDLSRYVQWVNNVIKNDASLLSFSINIIILLTILIKIL